MICVLFVLSSSVLKLRTKEFGRRIGYLDLGIELCSTMAVNIGKFAMFTRTFKSITRPYLMKSWPGSLVTRCVSSTLPQLKKEEVEVTFVKANGDKVKAKCKTGDSLLDVVVNNSIDLDGFGACEGTLTCSTCHVILKTEDYERLPEKPTDEELDMLDLAYDLSDTSRLGCQIIMTKDLNGLEVRVPATVNDARS